MPFTDQMGNRKWTHWHCPTKLRNYIITFNAECSLKWLSGRLFWKVETKCTHKSKPWVIIWHLFLKGLQFLKLATLIFVKLKAQQNTRSFLLAGCRKHKISFPDGCTFTALIRTTKVLESTDLLLAFAFQTERHVPLKAYCKLNI